MPQDVSSATGRSPAEANEAAQQSAEATWRPNAAPSADGDARSRSAAFSKKQLISVIDDDAGARDALKRLVRSLGYSGAAFVTAEEYLLSDLVCETACLICDVHLPGMSGPDLQARLAADGHRTPIVFITGIPDERIRTRVLKAGAVGYLAKPCDAKSLIDCLEKAAANTASWE